MKKEEKEIEACPFCLSDNLNYISNSQNLSRGWIVGRESALGADPVGGGAECQKCGKMIMPVVFKSKSEYEKVKKELGK